MSAGVDPAANRFHFGSRQLGAAGGHLQLALARDETDKRALVGVPRNDRRAEQLAAGECGLLHIETEGALLGVGAVAVEAGPSEDRQHIAMKIDRRGSRRFSSLAGGRHRARDRKNGGE